MFGEVYTIERWEAIVLVCVLSLRTFYWLIMGPSKAEACSIGGRVGESFLLFFDEAGEIDVWSSCT